MDRSLRLLKRYKYHHSDRNQSQPVSIVISAYTKCWKVDAEIVVWREERRILS